MERRVGDRQRNPHGPVDERGVRATTAKQEAMGDRTTDGSSNNNSSSRGDQQRRDQIQWHRIRSNKVGVDEGGAEERGGGKNPSPAPRSLSAKLRSGSGSSQFREVDFSDQVQGAGSAAPERPRYFGPSGGDDGDDEDANQQELRVLKNGDEVGRITVIKGGVQVGDGDGGQEGRPGDGRDGVVVREGAVCIGMDGSIEIGGGRAGDFGERRRRRRVAQVPQSLVLKDDGGGVDDPGKVVVVDHPLRPDDPRFSLGASTSRVRGPDRQASTDSFTTGGTELSSSSARGGGTATTVAEGEGDTPKPPRPQIPPQDEQEKPTLTPTSLAIYSSIQQQGSSRSGTCVLFTTAACTFVVTLVLTVAILIAPKTLASRGEDQAARAAPALAAVTTTANASDVPPAPHAALRAQTLTRVLASVQAPPTPPASSTPEAPSSTPAILQESQNETELFGDALRTR